MSSKFSAATLRQRRGRFVEWLEPVFASGFSAAAMDAVADQIAFQARLPRDNIFESLRIYAGAPNEISIQQLSWRLAANMDRLQVEAVRGWQPLVEDNLAVARVLDHVEYRRARDRQVMHRITWQFLQGPAASLESSVSWTYRACSLAASRMGFSRNYRFERPEDLVLLWAYVRIDHTRSAQHPQIGAVEPDAVCTKHNRELLRVRLRVRGGECPRRLLQACHNCQLGYADCPYAIRPRTLVQTYCPDCGDPQAYSDPQRPSCINCDRKERLR